MRIRDAYTAWSATYDTHVNPTRDLDALVTRQILAGLRPARILELGCGTGKNTSFLAEIGTHVQALDFSDGMLARAREKVPAANVSFAVADLTRRWPCEDHAVELIVCTLVLEHIEDLSCIFAEAARCLAPGGQMFLSELHPFKQYQGTKARIEDNRGTTEIDAYVHHLSDFLAAAGSAQLTLQRLDEWWHQADRQNPPLLLSLLFANEACGTR